MKWKQHLIFLTILIAVICIPAGFVKAGVLLIGALGYIVYSQTQE